MISDSKTFCILWVCGMRWKCRTLVF